MYGQTLSLQVWLTACSPIVGRLEYELLSEHAHKHTYILVRCRVQETTRIREPRGPWAVAFERSEDATKGPQGYLMRVVSMDEASN